jgi:rhodanese-related sulfurtransferase
MIEQIRPAAFAAWRRQFPADARPVLLDVREPWELQTASVKPDGFTLLAIPMNEIPARVAELPTDQPIACMCHHGARSQRVAAFLAQNGFEPVVNIAGGIAAWSAEVDSSVPNY